MNKKKIRKMELRKRKADQNKHRFEYEITPAGREFFAYYRAFSNKLYNQYSFATKKQYQIFVSKYAIFLLNNYTSKQIKKYLANKRIVNFIDIIQQMEENSNIDIHMEFSDKFDKPRIFLLLNDKEIIFDQAKLEADLLKELEKRFFY